jgi:signal transduction histidine kinase
VDKDLIEMALCNLMDNAIKASENNSIWQHFYVVDKARSRKSNGAGIGLSICKKIAEVHNSDIKINSELGKGAEVTLNFNNSTHVHK